MLTTKEYLDTILKNIKSECKMKLWINNVMLECANFIIKLYMQLYVVAHIVQIIL